MVHSVAAVQGVWKLYHLLCIHFGGLSIYAFGCAADVRASFTPLDQSASSGNRCRFIPYLLGAPVLSGGMETIRHLTIRRLLSLFDMAWRSCCACTFMRGIHHSEENTVVMDIYRKVNIKRPHGRFTFFNSRSLVMQ